MRFVTSLATFAVVLSMVPGFAQAEDALLRVPADAAVVLRLKSPDATIDRVAALADAVQEGLGTQVKDAAARTQSDPGLKGADLSRDWLLVMFAVAGSPPEFVVSLPASDADTLAAAAREPWVTAVHDDRVFGSRQAELLEKFAAVHDPGLFSGLDTASREMFEAGDLSAYVNVHILTETYSTEIDDLAERVRQGIDQIGQLPAEATGGVDMAAVAKMYQSIFMHLIQGARDTQDLTAAIHVDPNGLTIHERLRLSKGTATHRALAGQPTSDFSQLAQLPLGREMYFGFLGDMRALTKWNMEWTRAMFKDDQQQQGIDAITKTIDQIQYGAIVGAMGLGSPETGLLRATMIVEAEPVEKVRELMQEYGDTMGDLSINNFRQTMTISKECREVRLADSRPRHCPAGVRGPTSCHAAGDDQHDVRQRGHPIANCVSR